MYACIDTSFRTNSQGKESPTDVRYYFESRGARKKDRFVLWLNKEKEGGGADDNSLNP
jgi:hypothetical protein